MGRSAFLAAYLGFLLPSVAIGSSIIDKRATIDTCLSSAKVPVYTSGSSQWTQAIKPFNFRVTFTPTAYAVPNTVQDVQAAVSCGASSNVLVTAKSGGHSYGSHGLGGEDGHLIVDMRNFNSVTVDKAAQTAVIGTGGRLGNVAQALYSQGNQAISHGTCPGVGVGGLTLHGGYGLSSHGHGLTLDNMLEAEVVLANSTVVKASSTENPDLFWALRGAGAAFGIVTNFKFKTFTAPENGIVFQCFVSFGSASQLASFLTTLQDFVQKSQPPELNMRLFLSGFTTFSGVYYGSQSDFSRVTGTLFNNLGLSCSGTTNSWLNTLTSFSNGQLSQPANYDTHETFFDKSLMPSYLSPEAITALSNYWAANAQGNSRQWYLLFDCHGGKGSAISQVPLNATAYAHRNATFKMQFYDRVGSGSYNPQWMSFLNGWVKAITDTMPAVTFGMYINYADTSLSKEEAHQHYWLSNYQRLTQIKTVYDPKKVFMGPQLVGS